MRITDSAVAMNGSSSYSHYQESSSVVVQMSASNWNALQERIGSRQEQAAGAGRRDDAAVISISDEARKRHNGSEDKVRPGGDRHNGKASDVKEWLEDNRVETDGIEPSVRAESKDEQIIRILRRLTEMLRQMRNGGKMRSVSDLRKELRSEEMQDYDRKFENTMRRLGKNMPAGSVGVIDLTGNTFGSVGGSIRDVTVSNGAGAGKVFGSAEERRLSRENSGSLWVRYTSKSSFVMEQENTVFSTTGIAKTADGREISFNLDLEMSRAFAGTIQSESLETYNYVMTDPLVINLDDSPAGLSDQKFYFDLDQDGKKDKISSLRQGSAFLAYDKNGDGVINDGYELFGTKSGDGFADLADYDQDGNGWIDEGDDIYSKLSVWTKDENGNDRLMSLKEADVGAIYLGSASTDFHLNDAANNTNGMIRQTGIFLRESGGVGTVQHVDLAV
ncbi:MAG: hypothetical protein IJ232_03530 [Lachnospiraceae bacterium]|nr:hypothetical protein [Lachnospiraceae bacterium]